MQTKSWALSAGLFLSGVIAVLGQPTVPPPPWPGDDTPDYRTAIPNVDAENLGDATPQTVPIPPQIKPTTLLQHMSVEIGTAATLMASASGTEPMSYHWRLDGQDLPDQTSRKLSLSHAQPADEGDYTVVVLNAAGSMTSAPVRLWVVPRAADFVKGNFTNALGRLPYFYLLPKDYSPDRTYPLWVNFHGSPGDETVITTPNYGYPGYLNLPGTKTVVSFRQQTRDPTILLWPTRRAGDSYWTGNYLNQASAMLDDFVARFSVDKNRVYLSGASEGVHAAWDMIAMRPGFFAGAGLAAGAMGNAALNLVKDVPVWAWCAADDSWNLTATRDLVQALRRAGRTVPYTEYQFGGHLEGILMGLNTPVLLDWMLAQRRGIASTHEPRISITSPTSHPAVATSATNVTLTGTSTALGEPITSVSWVNAANNTRGTATGTESWVASGIPLAASRTNLILVTATTTSWASAFGGSTSFNESIAILQSPIRLTLTPQANHFLLQWSGGSPPYRVQHASSLLPADWTEVLSDAASPLELPRPLGKTTGFYRIRGE